LSSALTARERRILNPRPRRHHRPTYSLLEVRLGTGVLAVLGAIAGWVAWRGAHPDPELFAEVAAAGAGKTSAPATALPTGLTGPGWHEGTRSRFDATNLYEKIDGRADFFLSRGFRSLTFSSLAGEGSAAVDIEFYDMGSPDSALGVFAAEKPAEAKTEGGSWYRARNALFLARGPYYVRVLGSDESASVLAQLDAVRQALEKGLLGGERPWSQALLADALGVAPDRIGFEKESAFSFGFARNVFVARLADDETQAFVTATADANAARELARRFEEGFLSYGARESHGGGTWVKDRYLGSHSRAVAEGALVVGVVGAPQLPAAADALEKLRRAAAAMPADVVARAAQGATQEASRER
jgi:hypothetical protein